jgi:hypothetical protein
MSREESGGPKGGASFRVRRVALAVFAVLFLMNLLDYMDRNVLYAVHAGCSKRIPRQ